MSYFVTGATGFIGRHLVERLLEREGDIYVLVREGSEEKLEPCASAAGDRPTASSRSPATSPSRCSASPTRTSRRSQGVEHFFHLAAIYDMTADEERNARLNVERHPERGRPRQRARGEELPPRLLDRGRGQVRGPVHRGHLRRGPEADPPLPPHEVRVREARAAQRRKVPWRVYRPAIVVGNSRDRRDGQDRRARTTSSRRSRRSRHALPEWFPLVGHRGRQDEHRAGRLRRRRDGPHRPPARASTARPSTSSTRRCTARRRRHQHLRRGRPRAEDGHAHRQADDRHAARRACCPTP